jgi:hypothetical protein
LLLACTNNISAGLAILLGVVQGVVDFYNPHTTPCVLFLLLACANNISAGLAISLLDGATFYLHYNEYSLGILMSKE